MDNGRAGPVDTVATRRYGALSLMGPYADPMASAPGRRRAQPPSSLVRAIAKIGTPLGVVFAVLAVAHAVSLVANVVLRTGVYEVVIALGGMSLFGSLAYAVGIELRRNVPAWDEALEERRRATEE